LAWRQTVSDWGCTPPTAQYTMHAPSRTRIERSTSIVKSTCPGVSMMLKRCSGVGHVHPLPEAGRRRRGDGDPALLLLLHPVHGGRAVVHLADLVVHTGVEQDALGGGGLAGIDVREIPMLR
jgi:hypothetical protein